MPRFQNTPTKARCAGSPYPQPSPQHPKVESPRPRNNLWQKDAACPAGPQLPVQREYPLPTPEEVAEKRHRKSEKRKRRGPLHKRVVIYNMANEHSARASPVGEDQVEEIPLAQHFYANRKTGTPLPILHTLLTDDFTISDTMGKISRGDGAANPVPPNVCKAYWEKLYGRADNHVHGHIVKELEGKSHGKRQTIASASEAVEKQREVYRKDGTTWALSLEFLIYDLVEVAEGDFSRPNEHPVKEMRMKAEALRITRENLTDEFFDFVEEEASVSIEYKNRLDPKDLALWHGRGNWVTTMPLD